ncbi:MAG TPA: hypothetical protein VK487_08240 [Candidatus Bathyarchaeia archaeon]|nr:hypothetical protein [Candidatus Bathyarchaeia archaeon]
MSREIDLTKELAKRLQIRRFHDFKIYANKSPSRSSNLRKLWFERFHEQCPPLQPEMDMIIYEPSPEPKIRAFEIKYFERVDGIINQSFYKGIEQASALIQWGFDNVALWQIFDETITEDDLGNYGCRTWRYILGILQLPVGYTMLWLKGRNLDSVEFQVITTDWNKRPAPIIRLRNIDDSEFPFANVPPNPLIEREILHPAVKEEIHFLRNFLLEWLPKQNQGLA